MSQRPYGPPIYDAIERGDTRKLTSLVNQARQLHEKQGGDLGKAIKAGEAALKKLEKGTGAKNPAAKKPAAKAAAKSSAKSSKRK